MREKAREGEKEKMGKRILRPTKITRRPVKIDPVICDFSFFNVENRQAIKKKKKKEGGK